MKLLVLFTLLLGLILNVLNACKFRFPNFSQIVSARTI